MSWERRRSRLKETGWGRALLRVLSWGYGAAVLTRRALYKSGALKSRRLPAKVICIGNLTTGGTGKTPAVLLAAQTFKKRNHPVAILSRGYGRTRKDGEVTILLDDEPPPWTECGDEPWMMHYALQGQGIPILVSGDRLKAGEEAVTFYHSRVIILDDGFQHLRLKRDLDIVLLNAADPFGGERLLPLGDLREPLSGLSRAHLAVITHADRVDAERLKEIHARVEAAHPGLPVLEAAHKADFFLDPRTNKRLPLTHLRGRKVVAFSGIGDPVQFEEMLAGTGVTVAQRWRYPDHHPYRTRELRAIENLRSGLPVVTTFKDYTRLPKGWQSVLSDEVVLLAIRLEITRGRNVWIDRLTSLVGRS